MLSCACSGASSSVKLTPVNTALYVRADSDDTTVWAPRLNMGSRLGDGTTLAATYAVDAWTGASIDVVTAATEAIHEVRQEVTPSIAHEFSDVTLAAGYRYSGENDYWSHGGVLSADIDMASNNTTLGIALMGAMDTVGRSGDPGFKRPQDSIGGKVGLTQVLSSWAVGQLAWDVQRLTGYLASPYRAVAVGGDGLCYRTVGSQDVPSIASAFAAPLCLPESHPHERIRNAVSGKLRMSIGSAGSIGVNYRFYFDDWAIQSHTIWPDLALLIGEHGTLTLMFRYYTQTDSSFYKPRYLSQNQDLRYITRDRKMSALYNYRVGAEYIHDVELGESGDAVLKLALRGGLTRIHYQAFIGLSEVDVLELTGLLGLSFR